MRPYNDGVACRIRWLSFCDDPIAPFDAVEALALLPARPCRATASCTARCRCRLGRSFRLLFARRCRVRRGTISPTGWRVPWEASVCRRGGIIMGCRPDELKIQGVSCPHRTFLAGQDGIRLADAPTGPDSLNALSAEMTDLLIRHTAGVREGFARALRGGSRRRHARFMAGGDIRNFHKSLTENKEAHLAGFEMRVVRAHQLIYQIRRMAKPVLASVQGRGGGVRLSLILNCDLAIASDDPFFTLAYRHIGRRPTAARPISCRARRRRAQGARDCAAGRAFHRATGGTTAPNWIVPREARGRDRGDGASSPTADLRARRRQALDRTSFDNSWDEHSHREAEGWRPARRRRIMPRDSAAFLEKRKASFKGR